MDLFTKIYLYTSGAKHEVNTILSRFSKDLPSLDLSVMRNDDYDKERALEFPDGFLFFPYLIEIDVADSASIDQYTQDLSTLLKRLWQNNMAAIAASDLEEVLPEKGGYKNKNLPFPV